MVKTNGNITTFSWIKKEVFELICNESTYNSRVKVSDKGEPLFDAYAMSSDEYLFFDKNLRSAFAELSKHFRRISTVCSIADEDIVIAINAKKYDNSSDLEELDQNALDLLTCFILSEWYISLGLNDTANIYTKKITALSAMIYEIIFKLSRPESCVSYEATEHNDDIENG